MKYLLILILITGYAISSPLKIISDYDFTNQDYTHTQVKRFIRSFPNNRLSDENIWLGYWFCRAYTIHPLVWLSTQEKETSTISVPDCITNNYNWRIHRCMGYHLIKSVRVKGKKYYQHSFYEVQVYNGIKCLRKLFNNAKKDDIPEISINDDKEFIVYGNSATYALTRYTPYTHGIESFTSIYNKFRTKWDNLK